MPINRMPALTFADGRQQLKPIDALALEMALHEESERVALQGELAALETAWREAEEIAAIADSLPPRPRRSDRGAAQLIPTRSLRPAPVKTKQARPGSTSRPDLPSPDFLNLPAAPATGQATLQFP
jgi:hypothetical protein